MLDFESVLASKTLVMVVGPSAIGKSTIMNEVARQDPRFGRVRSFTTRPRRSNDETNQYFYFTDEQLREQTDSGTIVTDVIFPTSGYHYGTTVDSYGFEFNLLDTLANSVGSYRELPFQATVTISLTAASHDWETWLRKRYPVESDERTKRLSEAVASIEWSLAQTNDHYWVVNDPNDLVGTCQQLIAITTGMNAADQPTPPEAEELLRTAKSLLSYG